MKDIYMEFWGPFGGQEALSNMPFTYLGISIDCGCNALSFKMKARKY